MSEFRCGAVIGAGVVGLAVAAELGAAGLCRDLWVLEKEDGFGRGVSARTSEVIHAGVYYPPWSLKARLCIEGRERLYALCRRAGIAHAAIGKLVVAPGDGDLPALEQIHRNARACGVPVQELTAAGVSALEPHIRCAAALYCPASGIVDSHGLMRWFYGEARRHGVQFVFRTRVEEIGRTPDGYQLVAVSRSGERASLEADLVVNAAGLHSDAVARMAGLDYRLHWCKGCYFSVSPKKAALCARLIYPAVREHAAGLGVHVTLDLSGRMRLGPDAFYAGRVEDYSVPPGKEAQFCEAARYLPFLEPGDLQPEMAGIRPKLQGPGDSFADFAIHHGPSGFIHCVGIESPGLTAATAIAAHVRKLASGANRSAS